MAGTLPASDFHTDPQDRPDLRPRRRGGFALALAVLVAAAIAGWFWWTSHEAPQPPRAASVAPAAVEDGLRAEAPAAPAEHYPLTAPAEADVLAPGGIAAALQQLFGPGARFLVTDDFPRRVVATIDQLGREHAPPSLWPVTPTPERFLVEQQGETTVIAAANARRYAPVVDALTSVDAGAAVSLYRRLYPLLDRAWRGIGMGDRYLNDRVVAVIDLLLQTPEPAQPLAVRLTEVKGPVPSTRPWLRYEFADPALEALPAGQKILLRLDAGQRQKVRDQLRALRRHLVQAK